jgi:hypothetical protein
MTGARARMHQRGGEVGMVVRGKIGRLLSATGVLAATAALVVGGLPTAASASTTGTATTTIGSAVRAPAPKPPRPTAVQISGKFDGSPVTVKADEDLELFQSVLGQVSWLAEATPHITAPNVSKLGPKFTIVVLAKSAPQHTYDLYPLAGGGPRAYRPAKQPNGQKATPGWFYGQLTMSEVLRISGVPLPERPDVVSGGIGGGETVARDVEDEEMDAAAGVSEFIGEMRRLVLLNGAVVLIIAFGLAGMAYLIRRRV